MVATCQRYSSVTDSLTGPYRTHKTKVPAQGGAYICIATVPQRGGSHPPHPRTVNMGLESIFLSRGATAVVNAAVTATSAAPIPGAGVIPQIIQQIQQLVRDAKNNQVRCTLWLPRRSLTLDLCVGCVSEAG